MNPLTEEVARIVGDVLKLSPAGRAVLRDTASDRLIPEWTSSKHVEIIVAIEDRWNIEIPEDRIVKLTNVLKIADFVAGTQQS